MKDFFLRLICGFIPSRKARHSFRNYFKKSNTTTAHKHSESKLAHQYLDGLNGVEIGGSNQNSFGLEHTGGYANIDFTADQGKNWQSKDFQIKPVNLVSFGDDLPLKNNSVDYVISSHVIEHFFDPIKAIKEWLRVVKPGGYVFMIVPHRDRTFDRKRALTSVSELMDRYDQKLKLENYLISKITYDPETNTTNHDILKIIDTPKKVNDKTLEKYRRATVNDHIHWTVWNHETFLALMKKCKFKVIESQDPDDKVGNGFTVILKK